MVGKTLVGMDGILRCKVIEIPLKMGMESGTYVGKN
jgi:hypothetical protein